MCDMTHSYVWHDSFTQPIADKMAHNLEIVSKDSQFSTRRTRILMGFTMSTMSFKGTTRKSHRQHSMTHSHSKLQIRWDIILRLFRKTLTLAPGVPGFSGVPGFTISTMLFNGTTRKSHGQHSVVNPMGSILICWQSFGNIFKILCHIIYNWIQDSDGIYH